MNDLDDLNRLNDRALKVFIGCMVALGLMTIWCLVGVATAGGTQ